MPVRRARCGRAHGSGERAGRVYALRLWWKRPRGNSRLGPVEDVDLGVGYHQVVPVKGTLLGFVTPHGVTWRVDEVYLGLVAEGSATWREWRVGGSTGPAIIDVFVVQTVGPFEPGDDDEGEPG